MEKIVSAMCFCGLNFCCQWHIIVLANKKKKNRIDLARIPVLYLVRVSWKGTPKFVTAHNFTISVLLLFVNSANLMLP